MENLTNLQAELILTTYENVQSGISNNKQIEEAFKAIPEPSNEGLNYLMQIRAINVFVLTNYEELENMRTTIIDNQSDQNEVVEGYALESSATVTKPTKKRTYKPRKKSKSSGRRKK